MKRSRWRVRLFATLLFLSGIYGVYRAVTDFPDAVTNGQFAAITLTFAWGILGMALSIALTEGAPQTGQLLGWWILATGLAAGLTALYWIDSGLGSGPMAFAVGWAAAGLLGWGIAGSFRVR